MNAIKDKHEKRKKSGRISDDSEVIMERIIYNFVFPSHTHKYQFSMY